MDGIGTLMILAGLYFLPGIAASWRGHHNAAAIWILNLLLGWTLLGWAGAMVWAFTAVRKDLRGEPASNRSVTPQDPRDRTGEKVGGESERRK